MTKVMLEPSDGVVVALMHIMVTPSICILKDLFEASLV
uniref:Uncharacterized protein n=1 Tax=Rhizophora mucronata TaxID=61149 RepID=A0A2P2NIJ7_RHIMU